MRLAFALRELQQVQRALNVHFVRGKRREFRARRQQRREVDHEIDLELGKDAIEQRGFEDRSRELA